MVNKCPICGKIRENLNTNKYYPFCSIKCKNIDLYKWLNGEYDIDNISEEDLPIKFVETNGEN